MAEGRIDDVAAPRDLDAATGPQEEPWRSEDPNADARRCPTCNHLMQRRVPKTKYDVFTEGGSRLPLLIDATNAQDAILIARSIGMLLCKAALRAKPADTGGRAE